jgi:hypothetical protein
MRLRLFRGFPSLAIFSLQNGLTDPGRCIRRLQSGKPDAFEQIRLIFADALLYVASEILPKDTDKVQIAKMVFNAFQSLFEKRETVRAPGDVKIFLHRQVLNACKAIHPSLDEQAALLVVAFSEIARVIVETEKALPKKFQRVYRMKFVLQKSDEMIADELSIPLQEVASYILEVRNFMNTIPKWD